MLIDLLMVLLFGWLLCCVVHCLDVAFIG